MNTVAIVGVGLIGGSFGLALREAGFAGEIIGVSSKPALEDARRVGAITATASFEEACQAADLVYLSQTVTRIIESLPDIARYVRPETLITDAGSTKVTIVREAAAALPHNCFVGGHPLAGKETRGAASADGRLFQNRPYVLTPPIGPPCRHLDSFRQLLRSIGAVPIELNAEQHDETVAFTSHLPQLLSTALASMLEARDNALLLQLYGPGLLDMTRLALSSHDLWSAILDNNREQVVGALDAFTDQLAGLREAVSTGKVDSFFETAQRFARRLRQNTRN